MTDQSVRNPRQDERVIRVFVSSTFSDMQAERDYLVKFTFPALRQLREARGVTWGEVDLRRGVSEGSRGGPKHHSHFPDGDRPLPGGGSPETQV